jgi:hypothetical protein
MMKLLILAKSILFTTLCFAVFSSSTHAAKKMYKWVDANGRVFFSDQVPPDKANLTHEELDRNAQVVKVRQGAKTKAELEAEKRLMLLKKQQEQAMLKQKSRDKRLISSFLSVEAMDATYRLKEASLNEQEQEIHELIKQLGEELADQRKEAASYEIKNTPIPKTVLTKITEIEGSIVKANQDIKNLQVKKIESRQDFESDRARFLLLTQPNKASSTTTASETPSEKTSIQPGLFSCSTTEQCNKAWIIAKEFVKANSAAKITIDTDTFFASEEPVSETDLNLAISKAVIEGSKAEIFLDIRCAETAAAKALCISPKAEEIRSQFNLYIKAKLDTATTPATKK